MGLFDSVADVGTQAAESAGRVADPLNLVDEAGALRSISRQFDGTVGGGFADLGRTGERAAYDSDGDGTDDTFNNRYLRGDLARTLYDVSFSYDGTLNGSGDSADVFGPTLGGLADAAVTVDGESHGGEERKAKLLIYGVVALVVLYLLAPLFEFGAALLGE